MHSVESVNARDKVKVAGVIGAMGIVFGDIATSPLYTLQECLTGPHGVAPTPGNVLGCVSLIVWSLLLVVTVKYVGVPHAGGQSRRGWHPCAARAM